VNFQPGLPSFSAAAGGTERRVFGAGGKRLEPGEQREVLAELGVETADFGQHGVVGLAPFRHVIDRMQVADDAPGARQPLAGVGQGRDEAVPGGGCLGSRQGVDQRAVFVEQFADGGGDVVGNDGVEAGQAAEIEEWVHDGTS
jgi:hypothetical protein